MQTIGWKEALEFAVNLEKNGIEFYRQSAKNAPREEVKKIFVFLAGQEEKHLATFQRMVSTAAGEISPALGEVTTQELLDACAEAFFPAEEATGGKSVKKLSLHEAIAFGIKTERASINYYERIKSIAPPRDHSSIDRILQEERKHYDKLIELKKRGELQ